MAGVNATMELSRQATSGLIANLYRADAVVQQSVRDASTAAQEDMRNLMAFYCPVDTGFMQEHIAVDPILNGMGFEAGWKVMDFIEAGKAFYPYFVEFGTARMAAQPTLAPAFREIDPVYRARIREAVQAGIARLSARGGS